MGKLLKTEAERKEGHYTRLQSQLVAKMGVDSSLLTQSQQDTTSSPPCGNRTLDVWCRIIITLEFTGDDVYLPGQLRLYRPGYQPGSI